MAELYAKPYEVIDTGYNPQQTQQGGQDAEMQSYLESLPPEERQKAIERINAPLSGEELAVMAQSGQKAPTLEEYAEIEKYHKNQEVSFIEGLGRIAEGGEQVMTDLSNAFASFLSDPKDATSKMPATAVEAFSQGTRNFYGMLAQSGNPDSTLFRVKDFLNGSGTIEDRYNQYMEALKFNKESAELAEGKRTLVMDKDMINHEVTQAMAYIADPTLFIPFGKVASTGLRAVGLGEKLTMAGARAAAIKNGILGNTIKWGAGQPLEFMGGAVRNTIDYGLEKAGAAFEATTGISGKEFAQTARMSGVGFSASGVAGYAVPYASTISDAYLVGSSARGFGEALTLLGDTMAKNKFGRGINSWAADALAQAEKNGVALSPHAKGLLKTLNAVDPLFAYGWNGLETAAEGAFIGGGLGYLSGGEEGLYSGIGAGIALGAVGGTAGKVVADVTGGTNIARRAVQAKMVIEGHKVSNPEKAMFFQAMQKAAEIRGQDVDLVNGIIAGIDNVAPNFEFHALTPDQFVIEAKKKGYSPETGKFMEMSALETEFGTDRASKSKAMYVLRSVGGDFVGDRKGFLDAIKAASAKDSANPNKPASNIPLALRKYTDVAKTFDKLTKTQQEAVLKEIDGQGSKATELGGKTKLREFYDALSWSESWTDSLVKKFESDREGARKDITEMLAQETDKNGKLTSKGRALTDKLRAEGFLDKEGKLLRERNLLNADLTYSQFAFSKGALIARESDGKSHMYINLERMGDETFPHELFHTIMRESPMKKHFTDSLVTKLLGTVDKDGNLVRPAEVNIGQVTKFFKKYIDLTNRNDDGTLNAQAAESVFKQVQEALTEYQNAGANKKISDKARGLLENYSEEFGAYYFSHWLMGRNRNTLFFGGELKGIEGLVERTKDSFKDFWQSKVSKSNPEFDFSKGLNESFDRSKGLGRISSMDYYMRDMVRAASNANREAFRPDAMTLDNLKDFERSNGIRNLTSVDSNRRLNPREQVTQNIRLGKEAYKILSGLDKNLRTSKDVLDENGKQVITGRLSENELDALVKGGIVPRAWADKVNQGYAMLDGTISNIFSAGYLGKTEQTTDASYPRLTGKDVAFKNRKAVLTGIDTKIKADGTFYTLFHTLDLAVIEQEANRLWQNTDYRNLWNGDRASMEADFFRYISNASKASTDPKKLDSAALLERGDGLGGQRRDVLHQMGRMALQTGDSYKHQPIAVIPEGIRHSVTTFNIDGMTMPRVDTGTRYDIDMKNAHKFIRENWQPDEMKQEKTPSGVLMTHESGFKFSNINGKTTAYTSAGRKIGTFDNIKSATNAAKNEFKKVYDSLDRDVEKEVVRQNQEITKFQPLDENERNLAFGFGDLFAVPSVKAFVGDRLLLRQTREEHIFQRALEAIEDPEKLYDYALKAFQKEKVIFDESNRLQNEYEVLLDNYVKQKDSLETVFNRYEESLRDVPMPVEFNRFETWLQTRPEFKGIRKTIEDNGFYSIEGYLSKTDESEYYRQRALYDSERHDVRYKYTKTEDYQNQLKLFEAKREALELTVGKEVDLWREKTAKFREQNKIVLSHEGLQRAFETLEDFSYTSESGVGFTGNTSKAEQAKMLASLVKANVYAKDYSGLLEKLFSADYDDKIQTGVPFVAVTTHGTKSVRLMLTRLFEEGKLGTTFTWAESSKLGQFSAGSQKTSGSSEYQTSKRPISLSPEQYKFATKKIASFNDELLNIYADALMSEKQAQQYGGWSTGVVDKSGNTILLNREQLLERLKSHNKDRLNKGVEELSMTFIKQEGGYNNMSFFGLDGGNEGSLRGRAEAINPEIKERIKNYNKELSDFRNGYLKDNLTLRMVQEGVTLPEPVKMQTRQLIRMDNPYVVTDPRSYEEKNLSSHMKKAISLGHDGIVFKFLADGGDKDTVFAVFSEHIKKNIKVTETSFDPVNLPRGSDETGRKLLGGKDLKLHFQPTDESEAPKKIQGIKLDMTKAYDVFRKEYEESTGQSWSMDKFMQRAKNWQFFGDENGFVAVRPQRSGFVKLVGMAGDNKSKLRGIQQLQEQKLPVWGMVSKDIKDIAVRRGMREPNMIERAVLKKALNSAALGDAEILGYTSDNGVRLRYPDIGEVTKYMIGSPEYYQKLRSAFGEQVKNKIGFQPDEVSQGGRTYTDKQMSSEFIGRYASENAKVTKGLKPKFNIFTSGDQGNIELMKGQDSIGYINFSFSKATGDALIEYTNVARGQQGKGYGNLLYSELVERLRSMGMKEVQGMIIDERGRPQKIRERIIDKENARIGGDKTQIDYVEKDPDSDATHTGVTSYLYNKAWYQPDETKIGTQSSNVKLLLEGMRSGRILRTASYKGLGLEDSLLIAHTPDTAKIGQVTAGDKALADLQGGIFYAIANGNRIWASNFAGEGETNHLINFAKDQLEKNPNKKTYILLVKPVTGDNSKIFASVDGARGVSNIFKHLNDSKVMTDLRYVEALKESAKMHLKMEGLDGLGKEELYAKIDDALLNSKINGIGFKERANFTREIARQLDEAGAFDSERSKKALVNSFHKGFERGFSIVEMERVFGNLMAEDIIKNVPAGHVYGALEITSPLKESQSSNHRGYDASIEQESGKPAKLIMFDRTDHVTNIVNRKEGDVIPVWDKEKGSYMSYTGGNIPYQEVKGKSHMPFQPAEVHGITPSEGFKWFKRNKVKNIPHEREIEMDNILNDVLENGLSYNEAAQKNNDTFKNVYRIINNYVSDNPSALKLTPSERVKSYDYKWFAPLNENAKTRVPLSKAIKIDTALDDIASKRLDIETASKKYQIPRQTLEAYISKARNSKKGFPYFLQGKNSATRDDDPYVFNESTKRFKVSDENKKLMLSMYEDEGLSVENEIAPQFGISPNMIYKFIKEQKDLRDNKPSMQPAEFTEFKSEQSPMGRIMRNAKGYVITMANNKFRVYNPAKAIIGVYGSEEEAKKRIYREIPKQ